jgi:hypothetical protein
MDKKSKKELERMLRPSGAYLDSLADFADLLGKLGQPITGGTSASETAQGSTPFESAPIAW